MGLTARAVIGGLLAVWSFGCGDPFVVVGDAPGVVRIVAGVATVAGDSVAPQATDSELNDPRGLVVDADGVLYIADNGNVRIVAVTPANEIEVILDHEQRRTQPRMRRPDGLALDTGGRLLIADPEAHQVFRVDPDNPDATFELIAGTGTRGIAPDTVPALQADLDEPRGVAAAADGHIYFTERNRHVVRRLDLDGRMITVAGTGDGGFGGDGGPALAARLFRPTGLTLGDGVLYVADSGNNRVRALDLTTGVIETVAGSGGLGFSGDGGPAEDAFMDDPQAVATADGSAILFIADTGNQRIRTVDLGTGEIETFAGSGESEFGGDLIAAAEAGLESPLGLTLSSFNLLFISDTGHHIVLRTAVGFLTSR